jgi:crotonobetainyl-CoA:carnitine CoA-transferase CaiB-like acyl-CoA transferase
MGDHVCALTTALGIVTALLGRTRTGQGHLVETSLLRTGTYVMSGDISRYLRMGEVQQTPPRTSPVNPLNNFYQSAEGRWFFFMTRNKPHEWRAICDLCGQLELVDDPRFAEAPARLANSAALVALLDQGFARLPYETIAQALTAADLVWSPMQGPVEIVEDAQADAAGCFVEMVGIDGKSFRAPASPVRFDGLADACGHAVPDVGQHGLAILAEIGMTAEPERMSN